MRSAVFFILCFLLSCIAEGGLHANELSSGPGRLFKNTDEFKSRFNIYVSSNALDLKIGDIKLSEGNEQNTFEYMLNEYIGVLGSVSAKNNSVTSITLIGVEDKKARPASALIHYVKALIACVSPAYTAEEIEALMKELGLLENYKIDLYKVPPKTIVRKGIQYNVSGSQLTGLMFSVTKD